MVEIKGTTVRDSIESIRARLGATAFERFVASLDEPVRLLCTQPIHLSGWYSLDAFARLLEADVRVTDGGNPAGLVSRAEKVVEKQLSGIYRVFIRLGSPESLVKKIAAAHGTYFRGVAIEVVACERGRAAVRYVGFERQHQCVEHVIPGFFRKGLQLSGARDVGVRVTTPITAGTGVFELEMRWT